MGKARFILSVLIALALAVAFCQKTLACRGIAHLNKYANPGDDVTVVLQRLVERYSTVVIDEGEWLVSGEIQLRSNVTIKGADVQKSVIKRNGQFPLKSLMLFYTEKAYTDSYVRLNLADEFHSKLVHHKNICIENITIDFNRSPNRYSEQEIRGNNIYAIALIRAKNSGVKNCRFVDQMTAECNNGYPAIVIYQSDKITIENNVTESVTLLQATYSRNVVAKGNHCISSVGTALEFIAGKGHQCLENRVDTVWWPVSCIGVNSSNCVVKQNVVTSSPSNISCLTLGHDTIISQADHTVADGNVFHSSGCRAIIIQKGCDISLRDNVCSCIIKKDSPDMTSGCIVVSGNAKEINNIKIEHNALIATGDGNYGCITYRGSGKLLVKGNSISSKRGISILTNESCDAEIVGNTISCGDYALSSNSRGIKVLGNTLTDGIIVNSENIEIKNNRIEHSSHYSFLGDKWEYVTIEGNQVENTSKKELPYVFLLDGSKKTSNYNVDKVRVIGNVMKGRNKKEIIAVSSTASAPQLRRVKNINK